jgi:hypothetical protein
VSSYYAHRWGVIYFGTILDAIAAGAPPNWTENAAALLAWEQSWGKDTAEVFSNVTSGEDSVELATQMAKTWVDGSGFTEVPGMSMPVTEMITATWTLDVGTLMVLCNSDPACQGFTTEGALLRSTVPDKRVPTPGVSLYVK